MNSIETDFRSEMDQIETERIDSELPAILAGKVERFINYCVESQIENHGFYSDSDDRVFNTLSDLYTWWLTNVDNK